MARLKDKYRAEVMQALSRSSATRTSWRSRAWKRLSSTWGLGDCKDNAKALETAVSELATISGQKPLVTKAKKSHRELQAALGHERPARRSPCAATRMYEFTDKLVSIVLPRVRDFRGVSAKAFDGRGQPTRWACASS